MSESKHTYRVRKYSVVNKREEIDEMIQVSEFKDALRFYTGDKDIWTVFPDSYDCKWDNGHVIEKRISKEPNRKQPPQFGDVGCFSACRGRDFDMFVVVDYDELTDMIYAIFPVLTLKDDQTVQINRLNGTQIHLNSHDLPNFIPCNDTDEFKIYKFPYQRDSHCFFHSYLSMDAISTFYDD